MGISITDHLPDRAPDVSTWKMKSIALCLLLAVAVTARQTDYCELESCNKKEHTMCVYNISGANEGSCGPVLMRGVTAADQEAIVSSHNRIRTAVAAGMYKSRGLPAAKFLPQLQWDSELATVAQRAADNCLIGDEGMCNDVPRFKVGVNDAWIWEAADKKNWTEVVENHFFMQQLQDFKQTDLMFVPIDRSDESESESDRHTYSDTTKLSQLLWAGTTEVGCGYIVAKTNLTISETGEDFDDSPKHLYICHYGPEGNIPGQYIYQQDKM